MYICIKWLFAKAQVDAFWGRYIIDSGPPASQRLEVLCSRVAPTHQAGKTLVFSLKFDQFDPFSQMIQKFCQVWYIKRKNSEILSRLGALLESLHSLYHIFAVGWGGTIVTMFDLVPTLKMNVNLNSSVGLHANCCKGEVVYISSLFFWTAWEGNISNLAAAGGMFFFSFLVTKKTETFPPRFLTTSFFLIYLEWARPPPYDWK